MTPRKSSTLHNLTLLPLAALLACRTLPKDPAARAVAVGDVTHSVPLFTPLDPYGTSGRALDFAGSRDEKALADRISEASLSIDQIKATSTAIAAAVSVGGDQVSRSSTRATGSARESSRTVESGADPTVKSSGSSRAEDASSQTTTSATPAIPDAPEGQTMDPAVQSKLVDLLSRVDRKHVLPPDDVATIVASLKMYQNALEEYYNAGTLYDAALTGGTEWRPYRVHFTVTAEPGWYTQAHDYDAVLELELGAADQVRIVNVIPAQSLQTIEQFTAAYSNLSTALEVKGSYSRVAARAAVKRIAAAANRLQGMRSNTTFTASFPAVNKLRLRFYPSEVPDGKDRRALEPLTRIVAATVLVRKDSAAASLQKIVLTDKQKQTSEPLSDAVESEWQRIVQKSQATVKSRAWYETTAGTRRADEVQLCTAPTTKGGRCEAYSEAKVEVAGWMPRRQLGTLAIDRADGYFWDDGAVTRAVLSYDVRTPDLAVYQMTVFGPGVPDTSYIVRAPDQEVLEFELKPTAVANQNSVPMYLQLERYLVGEHDASLTRPVTRELVLRRMPGKPAAPKPEPTIQIQRNTVDMQPVPLKDIPPDVLRILLGERVKPNASEAAPAKPSK